MRQLCVQTRPQDVFRTAVPVLMAMLEPMARLVPLATPVQVEYSFSSCRYSRTSAGCGMLQVIIIIRFYIAQFPRKLNVLYIKIVHRKLY